jgi:hypothetical protein
MQRPVWQLLQIALVATLIPFYHGAMRHLEAFQAIADAHDDNRAAGTSGYDASAAYVAGQSVSDFATSSLIESARRVLRARRKRPLPSRRVLPLSGNSIVGALSQVGSSGATGMSPEMRCERMTIPSELTRGMLSHPRRTAPRSNPSSVEPTERDLTADLSSRAIPKPQLDATMHGHRT